MNFIRKPTKIKGQGFRSFTTSLLLHLHYYCFFFLKKINRGLSHQLSIKPETATPSTIFITKQLVYHIEETHNTATAATPTISGDLMSSHFQFSDQNSLAKPDVQILTSNGLRIPAHTGILVRPFSFSFSSFRFP